MKAFKIGLMLILSSITLSAQNYKLFELNKPQFYSCSNNKFSGLKIENISTITGQNGVLEKRYYNYKWNFDNLSPLLKINACNSTTMDSWLGKYVSSYTNGKYVFYNKVNDSIIIYTDTAIHNWILYSLPQNGNISASINKSLSNDSLLVIELTVNAIVLDSILNQINNSKIILSKNDGILRAFDFSEFPQKFIIYNQIDKSLLDSSVYSSNSIYNFKIGDRFQYYQEVFLQVPQFTNDYIYSDIIINSKNGYKYTAQKRELAVHKSNPSYYTDSTTIINLDYQKHLNANMPNTISSSIFNPDNLTATTIFFDNDLQRYIKKEIEFNCSFSYNTEGDEIYIYRGMMGVIEYNHNAWMGRPYIAHEKLVYFNNGINSFGDTINFNAALLSHFPWLGIELKQNKLSIFPNPTSSYINILSSNMFEKISVLNVDGRVVLEVVMPIDNVVQINELPIGMYMLKAIDPNGRIYSSRFIKN